MGGFFSYLSLSIYKGDTVHRFFLTLHGKLIRLLQDVTLAHEVRHASSSGGFVSSGYNLSRRGGGEHDIAQICISGHIINSSTKKRPQFNKNFCDRCGQRSIRECQSCAEPIQGDYYGAFAMKAAPAFCHNCGAAYPWTESRLKAAHDLAMEIEGLTDTEKETLSGSLDDLIRDTPSTPVAATRFKKLAVKAGKEGAGALRDILVDIVSETAKKLIWPNP